MIEQIRSDCVSAEVVVEVGHIAPVSFDLGNGAVARPYSLPGWTPEECEVEVPAIKWLRGEFFGFPFGTSEGFDHVHGPAANGSWSVLERSESEIMLAVDLPSLCGRIEKHVQLREGHRALYLEHRVLGVEGRFNYGHHPVLRVPEGETVEIRTSPFKFGSVYPDVFGDASKGDVNLLKEGGRFESLDAVPLRAGGTLSVKTYPTPVRQEDLVMMGAADSVELGWTAVSYSGYVWIALRSTRQFPSTLFWLSNGGCAQEPWNGVNGRRIGVEDVCSYFSLGLQRSREDLLADKGIETTKLFSKEVPTVLRHGQLVHPTDGKQAVAAVRPLPGQAKLELEFESGERSEVDFDWQWLLEPDLEK